MKLLLTTLISAVLIYAGFGQEKSSVFSSEKKHVYNFSKRELNRSPLYSVPRKSKISFLDHSNNKEAKKLNKVTTDIQTGYLYQFWDSGWNDSERYTATLDETGYKVEEVWEVLSGSNWINSIKETETHDANGNWLEWIKYIWSTDWVGSEKQVQSYDANGNWSEWTVYSWHSDWIDSLKRTQTFELNGNSSEVFGYSFNGSQWELDDREIITYDGNANWVEWIDYNPQGTIWEYSEKQIQEFDLNGNWTNWIAYEWNGTDWVPYDRETLEYNTNGDWTEWVDYDWVQSNWEARDKENAEYSGNNLTLWTAQTWNGSWVNWWQEDYFYDANNNNSELIYKEWNGSDWENVERYTYTYSSVTGISGIPAAVFKYALSNNYPNPFNPSTLISYQLAEKGFVSLKVYDITGTEIISLVNENKDAGNHEANFTPDGLSSGIYLYQLKVNNFTSTKKMMLLK